MADAYDPTKETLQEWQQRQAMDAVAASQNHPNAIPNEAPEKDFGNTRAVDYAQRGLPLGNTVQGDADPNAPKTGFYTNQAGENLGNVQPGQQSPQGSTGIQGVLSPQEQAFWAANPNGAVKDPSTGNLVGLGTVAPPPTPVGPDGMVTVNSGLGPPSTPYNQQTRINTGLGPPAIPNQVQQEVPDFVHIPEVNPVLIAQRQQIQNEIATTQNQLRSASSQRSRGQPSQRDILTQKLSTLTDANNSLGLEHYRQSEEQRKASDKNTEYQTKYLTNQDVMSANKEISQIQATHGSADYKRKYFQIVNEKYPKAMDDPIFKASAERTALSHDERSDARERAVAAGYTVQDTGIGQKGVSQKFVAPAAVSQQQAITKATQKKIGDDFAKSGLTPEQFSQRGAVVGTDKEGKQVPNADATHMKVDIGGHHTLMPVETFNRLNGAYPAANANPTAQPSATPSVAPQGTREVGGKTYAWNGQRWEPQ